MILANTIAPPAAACAGSMGAGGAIVAPDRAAAAQRAAQLITPAQLAETLASSEPVIVIELASPLELEVDPRRIPGSSRVWRPEYQQETGLDGIVPTAAAFTALARRLGIDAHSQIVLVDRKYDATRLWWLFQLFGKTDGVRLLDGGWQAWLAEGLPITVSAPLSPPPAGTWTALDPEPRLLATREAVLALAVAPDRQLWDVRTVEEHTGAKTMQNAARPGRIPWTTERVEWGLFRRPDGSWCSAEEVGALAEAALGGTSVGDGTTHTFYCQSGVRTTQLIFGLALAGWPLERLRNYDGSWVEWSHLADDAAVVVGTPQKVACQDTSE